MTNARNTPVFSAGGHCFTWVEVIEAARARGDWAALQRHVLAVLARESELAATNELPSAVRVQAAARQFRYRHNLISADDLEEWLSRRDITIDEWIAEVRRSLLEPAADVSLSSPEAVERADWVHAICSGKLAAFAKTLAEEVAVHVSEQPLTLARDELAALSEKRERFGAAQVVESTLAREVRDNNVGWTRFDLQYLVHADDMVVREAALCVRLDGRNLGDVAADVGVPLHETSLLLEDAEPVLRTRLIAASPGEVVGPHATESGHQLVHVVRRVPPTLDDAGVRRRAEEAITRRALAAQVNRHVNWHEQL